MRDRINRDRRDASFERAVSRRIYKYRLMYFSKVLGPIGPVSSSDSVDALIDWADSHGRGTGSRYWIEAKDQPASIQVHAG